LIWDISTAYDLFVSLEVLNNPQEYAVRSAWAAGVRARIPVIQRALLEQPLCNYLISLSWIHKLPQPKDSDTVIQVLSQIPAERILPTLFLIPGVDDDLTELLMDVYERRKWKVADRRELKVVFRRVFKDCPPKGKLNDQDLGTILDFWTHPKEFGERYLEALVVYQEVFFAEEERRIRPALQSALSSAQVLAKRRAPIDLMEELSQGLRFEEVTEASQLILAPSYWTTPFVHFQKTDEGHTIYLFGARSATDSLVPGDGVPDAMLRVMKALSDSTRVQILQYLSEQPHTPTQLSKKLRLRIPTVVHHLDTLRLAGLVTLTLGEEGITKHYAARLDAIETAFTTLQSFLSEK